MMSNISYHTKEFLKAKLDDLYNNNHLDFYMFIIHKKEEDELSDHIHVIMYPSHIIDFTQLKKEFNEFIIGEDLPRNFSSKWKPVSKDHDLDWILYILHDDIYCKATSKGIKKYHYTPDEIICPDEHTKQDLVFQAYHETEFYHDKAISEMIVSKNMSGSDLITNGYVPISKACGYHHYLQMLRGG